MGSWPLSDHQAGLSTRHQAEPRDQELFSGPRLVPQEKGAQRRAGWQGPAVLRSQEGAGSPNAGGLLTPPQAILGRQRPLCLTLPCWNQRGGCPQTWLLVSRKDRDGSVLGFCPGGPEPPLWPGRRAGVCHRCWALPRMPGRTSASRAGFAFSLDLDGNLPTLSPGQFWPHVVGAEAHLVAHTCSRRLGSPPTPVMPALEVEEVLVLLW